MAWTTPKTYSTNAVLTASDMNTYQRDNFDALAPDGVTVQTFTPTLGASTTAPTLGTGSTATGVAYRVGKLAVVNIGISFGTAGTNAGSGQYQVSISPLGAGFNFNSNLTSTPYAVGSGRLYDSSAATNYNVTVVTQSATQVRFRYEGSDGVVDSTGPFAWSTSDQIDFVLAYITA